MAFASSPDGATIWGPLSTEGGIQPKWYGKDELIYVDDLGLMSVKLNLDKGFGWEKPVSVLEEQQAGVVNVAVYLSKGRVLHVHRKCYLPTYGLFQEGREFAPGNRVRRFDSPWGPAGLLICEDLWHMPCAWLLAQQGAEVIFVLSNGPTRGAKPEREVTSIAVWRELLQTTAQFQTTWMVYVNRTGCEDGLTFGGGSLVVDPFGRISSQAPALDEALEVVDLKSEVLRRARTVYPLLRDENLELVERELGRLRQLRYDLPDPASSTEKDKVV